MQDSALKDKLKALPDSPGVYLLKNARGEIIYIGKAKSLKRRLPAYFTRSKDIKTLHLQARIRDLEIFPAHSEGEALLLENNLIKRWTPKYNINLKDGKTYPVIRLTNEEYPRVFRTRRLVFDGSRYYGPFPRVSQIDLYLNLIDRLFPLRKCTGKVGSRKQPCFYYHIGRCAGVCAGKITREQYMERVAKVQMLLSGKTAELLKELRQRMQEASAAQEYERAASFRDEIAAIESLAEEQRVVDFQSESRDYLGLSREGESVRLTVLQMRGGKLVGRETLTLEGVAPEEDFLPTFLGQYYGGRDAPPRSVYLPSSFAETHDPVMLGSFLSELTGTPMSVHIPRKGKHAHLVETAMENARFRLERESQTRERALQELQQSLGLRYPPRRIEGFDIAHLSGKQTVASLVTFLEGQPRKGGYRHYHIRSLHGRIDDFESMREAVARRYTRQLNENRELPDLILIDGGKGQVSAAESMLKALEIQEVPLVGLAKKNEELYLPGRAEPLRLPRSSEALHILQAVRDEAHRFATTFHKRVRAAQLNTSVLESIPGIGRKRSVALLTAFGSLAGILAGEPEQIARAGRLGLDKAKELLAALRALQERK